MTEDVMLQCEFNDVNDLSRAFMPFVRGGAVFLADGEERELHDQIQVSMVLPNESEPICFSGKVVWITPNTAKVMWHTPENTTGDSRSSGVGVQFSTPEAREVMKKISDLLKEHEGSSSGSDTI